MARRQHVMRQRYDATAPGYDELYMEEQVEKYAAALSRARPRGVVLDAGCGTALLAEYMEATGMAGGVEAYVCLDLSPRMLGIARARLKSLGRQAARHVVEGDLEHLPFRDRAFDAVYSFTVVDLLEDPGRGLAEIRRVSRGPVVFSLLKKAHLLRRSSPAHRYLAETEKDWILCMGPCEKKERGDGCLRRGARGA